uniref:Integrase, catalytic region, zinc finger, CCHC-type, peptidase aspartic, catalytic n=1 Tax=Tanacetum cinerariifolium TaxID=118510 RepID=A0A6L2KQQ6_TANCI|nr:hypothetical protein [Tanacetum cinerariifolium]
MLAELRTNYDREHSKVLELVAEVLKRQHMIIESEKRLKDQLQGKDETIRNLQAQHDIVSLLNVSPTDGIKALETELTQLKDTITTLKIQNDRFKVTNATQKTEIAKLKAKDVGNKSSGTTTPTNPKSTCSGNVRHRILDLMEDLLELSPSISSSSNVTMLSRSQGRTVADSYAETSKDHEYFIMNLKKHVTFKEPPKPSPRVTKKPIAPQTTKKVWKQKVVAHAKSQWMPTGRHFTLYDSYPLTRILDPIKEPLELSPSVSSSSNVTMLSRFANCQLSDRKAGKYVVKKTIVPICVDYFIFVQPEI